MYVLLAKDGQYVDYSMSLRLTSQTDLDNGNAWTLVNDTDPGLLIFIPDPAKTLINKLENDQVSLRVLKTIFGLL